MTRRPSFWVFFISGLLVAGLTAGVHAEADQAKIERGAHLATVAGCHDCHSPKVFTPEGIPMPDETRLLSGHPADVPLAKYEKDWIAPGQWILFGGHFTVTVGPWGVTYAANLTPDDQTGIGLWTEDVFVNALRTGKHMGKGRPIMPPMPWPSIGQMTDEELGTIFAYLKSLPPIKNKVPEPVLAPPPTQ